jgi:trehalose/maltose transport system substrate-binding protein
LTCNALEWQVSEGGGRIIEDDRTISVNNAGTILGLQRAKHWIGWISPPGVVSNEEWDAINAFYQGRAVFYRGWALTYFLSVETQPEVRDRIGITNVPGDGEGGAATLGGFGLGISRTTVHPAEALKLVRFLVRREKQFEAVRWNADPSNSDFAVIREDQQGGNVVRRPSAVAGQRYEDVDHAYIGAVHSVLMGEVSAPEAIASLERELVRITGFKTGPPSRMGATQRESAK